MSPFCNMLGAFLNQESGGETSRHSGWPRHRPVTGDPEENAGVQSGVREISLIVSHPAKSKPRPESQPARGIKVQSVTSDPLSSRLSTTRPKPATTLL